jgi:hypothetical protein
MKMIIEKLLDVYSSADIVRLIHSLRRGWVGCVAHMGKCEMYTGFLWGNLKERVHLENPQHSCEDNIKWIRKK